MAASASVLPPAPAQRSITCSSGFAPAEQRGKLRALVLDFDLAFQIGRLGMDRGAFGIRADLDAQAPGRPARGLRRVLGKLLHSLLTCRLQRVGAQVERRTRRERLRLLGALVAETSRRASRRAIRDSRHAHAAARLQGSSRAAAHARRRIAAQAQNGSRRSSREIASTSSPRSRASMPSSTARGVSAPMIQADDNLRRSAS